MKKQQKEAIIFIIVLLGVVYIYMPKGKKTPAQGVAVELPPATEQTSVSTPTEQPLVPPEGQSQGIDYLALKSHFPNWSRRDPFEVPLKKTAIQTDQGVVEIFKLKAIIKFGDAFYAVINNQVVKPGDIILGAKVMKIEQAQVILSESGGEFALKLSK